MKEDFLKRMQEVSSDPEQGHIEADEILCEIAAKHGYYEVVSIFESLKKWYA